MAGLIHPGEQNSPQAEAYRMTRTQLEMLCRTLGVRVLLVTSPTRGDGKTTTASNLAISLAAAGRRVLLVDADLRKPALHDLFGLPGSRGLARVLEGVDQTDKAIQPTSIAGLDLMACGSGTFHPADVLASAPLAEFLREVREQYDLVILDSSPVLAVTDPLILAAVVDGTLMVVRAGQTTREDVAGAADLLRGIPRPLVGVVMNDVAPRTRGYMYSGSVGLDGAELLREISGPLAGVAVNEVVTNTRGYDYDGRAEPNGRMSES